MTKKKNLKIVLDTNWYVSASINRNSRRRLYELLINENLKIFASRELIQEYLGVISRNKFEKYIRQDQAMRFLTLLLSKIKLIELKTPVQLSSDPKDNFLLSICADCNADYLITGDPDLLEIGKFGKTEMVTMTGFEIVIASGAE